MREGRGPKFHSGEPGGFGHECGPEAPSANRLDREDLLVLLRAVLKSLPVSRIDVDGAHVTIRVAMPGSVP